MIRQQRTQRRTISNRVAPKPRILSQPCELPIRRADLRTLKIVHIKIGQQMKSRLQLNHLDSSAAVIRDERMTSRDHQQVERIVIRPALPRCELRRLFSTPASQRIERQQPARSRHRITPTFSAPIQQPRNDSMLTDSEPSPPGLQIFSTNHMRILTQRSRIIRRPRKKLIPIGSNHDRIIAQGLKINRERTHRNKVGSREPPPQSTNRLI